MSQDTIPSKPFEAVAKRLRDALNLSRNMGVDVGMEFTWLNRLSLKGHALSKPLIIEKINTLLQNDPQLKVKAKVLYVDLHGDSATGYSFIKVTVRPLN